MQYGIFKIAQASTFDGRWRALNRFASYYADILDIAVTPVPLFGHTYFSTGSFSYYKTLGLRLEKEYYVLSVDKSDPPLFWPLALHELSHCWLGRRDDVDRICSRHIDEISRIEDMTRINRSIIEKRIEEALCDVIATYTIGPSYPYSYLNKLWAQFPAGILPEYPSHRFRIECMATVLDEMELFEQARNLRCIGDTKFSEPWQNEEIHWAIDDIVSGISELPKLIVDEVDVKANRAVDALEISPPKDIPTLFLACWMFLGNFEPSEIPLAITRTSEIILREMG